MKNPEDNLIVVMTGKEITKLYKTLLEIVEDLQKDHEIMLEKVANKNDLEFANNVNYFTKAKYEQLRKRFLNIYVGQKEKEKDNTSEEKNRTQEFMYYIEMPDSSSRDLLFRLRQRSYKVPSNFRRDDAISEV